MYAQQPPTPPRVDPAELRPGRAGYWAGGLAIVLGGIAGIVLFVFFIARAVALPDLAVEVPGSGEGAFSHTPGTETAIVALYSTSALGSPDDCGLVAPAGEPVGFSDPGFTHETAEWTLVGAASPQESGEYTLVCEGARDASYAVAAVPADFGMAGDIAGALAAFFLIPLAGLALGLILIITTAVRRGKHRKRLIAERGGYPYRG
ncbi:hypothetical protein [Nocardiopsis sp. CC223A]|uniref:hypothetical protein n=1 Tax=Nocardiopsis sp. CC223A TaxID=3044051 RepID=UPI00278C8AB6|nr:hypothetical protein [Nocardiopsis sp. CC223A]